MAANYFNIGFRNLMKYKYISGMTLFEFTGEIDLLPAGMACIINELSLAEY